MLVLDDFISDDYLLGRINSATTPSDKQFWCEDFPLYSGWEKTGVSCLVHEFIKYVFTDERLSGLNESVKYYEFWTNSTHSDTNFTAFSRSWAHTPHFDKDENLLKYKNEYAFPKAGIVFYGDESINSTEGGLFYYWPESNIHDTDLESKTIPEPYKTIEPKFNRLILLDSSKLHGVGKITLGKRRSIAVNLWEVEPYDEESFLEED